jgi:hypothetical protein
VNRKKTFSRVESETLETWKEGIGKGNGTLPSGRAAEGEETGRGHRSGSGNGLLGTEITEPTPLLLTSEDQVQSSTASQPSPEKHPTDYT